MITANTHTIFRANLDDVERLSYGKGAKRQRGTGSRAVCHRLNRDERTLFEKAKQTGYLVVRGTGFRKERKGSPICNTFRQRCDALQEVCIIIEKRAAVDTVLIDFSTLRVKEDAALVTVVLENVLKPKYPELYATLLLLANAHGDGDGGNYVDAAKVIEPKIPIQWDAVKSNPIWGVHERLLKLNCDRDVAKALVLDVLNECHGGAFHDLLRQSQSQSSEIRSSTTAVEAEVELELEEQSPENKVLQGADTGIDNNKDKEEEENDDGIDWDDI